jgi:hypothetical protein
MAYLYPLVVVFRVFDLLIHQRRGDRVSYSQNKQIFFLSTAVSSIGYGLDDRGVGVGVPVWQRILIFFRPSLGSTRLPV